MTKIYPALFAVFVFLLSSCSADNQTTATDSNTATIPKNIIMVIGDGMGPEHTTAYRYYADNPDTPEIETTIFDELLTGMSSTYPEDETLVTDSASSATALASGIKTYNAAIGVDSQKRPVETVLERASKIGKNTAIVVTSQINHATPASYIAHNESRQNYDEIADNYLSNQINGKPVIDLMLGGGTRYFIREDRNLVEEFVALGYQYIDDLSDLDELTALPAMGLFAPAGLPHAIDDPDYPDRLNQMTTKALSLLSQNNPNGFFMMVEGSQIDWCAHANDIACDMKEMEDFAFTLETLKSFAEQDGETLVIVTADHNTGGFSIGGYDEYLWEPGLVHQIHASVQTLTTEMSVADDLAAVWNANVDFELTEQEIEQLVAAKNISDDALNEQLLDIINRRTYSGWTTYGHTGGDVQVFAIGTGSGDFAGYQDNTDIAKNIFRLLNQ